MLDLDSIVADEAVENDLEEVVMGLIINSGQARSSGLCRTEAGQAGRFRRGENHDGPVPHGAERSAPGADKAD